ncbi:hypothetical protein LTR85_000571 [Meristemomyces frigidus]|nr:hypothetical protein LTR85_000571 [Meristemomyces frigidus]
MLLTRLIAIILQGFLWVQLHLPALPKTLDAPPPLPPNQTALTNATEVFSIYIGNRTTNITALVLTVYGNVKEPIATVAAPPITKTYCDAGTQASPSDLDCEDWEIPPSCPGCKDLEADVADLTEQLGDADAKIKRLRRKLAAPGLQQCKKDTQLAMKLHASEAIRDALAKRLAELRPRAKKAEDKSKTRQKGTDRGTQTEHDSSTVPKACFLEEEARRKKTTERLEDAEGVIEELREAKGAAEARIKQELTIVEDQKKLVEDEKRRADDAGKRAADADKRAADAQKRAADAEKRASEEKDAADGEKRRADAEKQRADREEDARKTAESAHRDALKALAVPDPETVEKAKKAEDERAALKEEVGSLASELRTAREAGKQNTAAAEKQARAQVIVIDQLHERIRELESVADSTTQQWELQESQMVAEKDKTIDQQQQRIKLLEDAGRELEQQTSRFIDERDKATDRQQQRIELLDNAGRELEQSRDGMVAEKDKTIDNLQQRIRTLEHAATQGEHHLPDHDMFVEEAELPAGSIEKQRASETDAHAQTTSDRRPQPETTSDWETTSSALDLNPNPQCPTCAGIAEQGVCYDCQCYACQCQLSNGVCTNLQCEVVMGPGLQGDGTIAPMKSFVSQFADTTGQQHYGGFEGDQFPLDFMGGPAQPLAAAAPNLGSDGLMGDGNARAGLAGPEDEVNFDDFIDDDMFGFGGEQNESSPSQGEQIGVVGSAAGVEDQEEDEDNERQPPAEPTDFQAAYDGLTPEDQWRFDDGEIDLPGLDVVNDLPAGHLPLGPPPEHFSKNLMDPPSTQEQMVGSTGAAKRSAARAPADAPYQENARAGPGIQRPANNGGDTPAPAPSSAQPPIFRTRRMAHMRRPQRRGIGDGSDVIDPDEWE